MTTTPNLGITRIDASQAQKHVTANEAFLRLDTLVQCAVEARQTTPPGSPAEGARYIPVATATGAWAGQEGTIAVWQSGAWVFLTPAEGWQAWDRATDTLLVHSGSAWGVLDPGALDFSTLGVGGAAADATDRLAVTSPAVRLDAETDDIRLKLNKTAAGDTASALFQTGSSGRAEVGLVGDDDLAIKVSADGSAWTEALRFDKTTGLATGDAVQSSATDGTAGRLLTVGAFGLGADSSPPVISDMDSHNTRSGFYSYTGSVIGTLPSGATTFGFVLVSRQAATGISQTLFSSNGLGLWWRAASGGTWTAWTKIYAQNSILGTVSEASGVPTGAVIERGSNANGEYVRFADGTQICTRTVSGGSIAIATAYYGGFRSVVTDADFAAAFAAAPQVAVNNHDAASAFGVEAVSTTVAKTSLRWLSVTSQAAAARAAEIIAVGRWFI